MLVALLILFLVVPACAVVALALVKRTDLLKGQLRDAARHIEALRQSRTDLDATRAESAELARRLQIADGEDQKKAHWLDRQQEEIDWLRAELEKRPRITQKRYKILTLGAKWTGKTSLTLKWANPLVDLGTIRGTKIERYERTVSHVTTKEITTEHVFEIGDWGGEHIVDAQQELVMDEIHGLLIVVDLTGKDGQRLDHARVEEQLRDFQSQSMRYFFGPKTLASCKTVVLFINKSDVLSGTPAEVEQEAKSYYKPLIDALELYKTHIDIRVLVGSATYGHSTHFLFSHFVERILPRNAYDPQLLQRMKAEPPPLPPPATPPLRASLPLPPPLHAPPPLPPRNGQPPVPTTRLPQSSFHDR